MREGGGSSGMSGSYGGILESFEDDPDNSTRPSGGMGGSISRGPAATGGGGSGGWGGGAPTDDYVGGPEGMNIMR